jgi:hypothetical protein
VDGFQGTRVTPKVTIDHSYVVSNVLPTVFYLQQFNLNKLNPASDNYFLELDKQAQSSSEWRPKAFEIVLFDAYTVDRI